MKVRYRETIEGIEVQAVFLASDLELRWLKAWGGGVLNSDGPRMLRDALCTALGVDDLQQVQAEGTDWPEFNLTDATLSIAFDDNPPGPNPFAVAFVTDLVGEPAYVLEDMLPKFKHGELEQMAARWQFPDWCCVWRKTPWPHPPERPTRTPARTFEERVAEAVHRTAATKRAQADSMRHQGEALLRKAHDLSNKVAWYLAEQKGHDAAGARAAEAEGLDGMVDRACPDLPVQEVAALQALLDLLTARIPESDHPESVREVRAHLLMVRKHIENAREDAVARLWAAPLGEVGQVYADTTWLSRIRERCERLMRVGCGDPKVSLPEIAATLDQVVHAALGLRAACIVFPSLHRRESATRCRIVPWGDSIKSPSSLQATVNCERLLRWVFPRTLKMQEQLARDGARNGLTFDMSKVGLQVGADRLIADGCEALNLKPGYLTASARVVQDGRDTGLQLLFEPCAEADRELMLGVLRELAMEHSMVRDNAVPEDPADG